MVRCLVYLVAVCAVASGFVISPRGSRCINHPARPLVTASSSKGEAGKLLVLKSSTDDDEDDDDDEESDFMTRLVVVEALRAVKNGEEDVVGGGLVESVTIGKEVLRVKLASSVDADVAAQCETAVKEALVASDIELTVEIGAKVAEKRRLGGVALQGVAKVVAVSSCKGGVGKSTVSVMLARTLMARGLKVGIADVDIHGPSLRVLVGEPDDPTVRLASEMDANSRELLEPFTRDGLKLMSFAYLTSEAAVMRGSMVAGVVEQLTTSVAWRELDFLIVDMPPGTGDVQLTLTQTVPIDAAIVVTTPTRLSFEDVVKGVDLFDKVSVPVVAVVENMALFEPDKQEAAVLADEFLAKFPSEGREELVSLLARPHAIFGAGHSRKLKEMWGIEHSFQIGLVPALARPFNDAPSKEASMLKAQEVFGSLADAIVEEVSLSEDYANPVVGYSLGKVTADHCGVVHSIDPATLRSECRCATCVDEFTGESRIVTKINEDVAPTSIATNGNYAVSIDWSDGHRSLYPYKAFVPNYAQARAKALKKKSPLRQPELLQGA